MRRISALGLRFPSVTYAYVRFRQEIRAFLELLASTPVLGGCCKLGCGARYALFCLHLALFLGRAT